MSPLFILAVGLAGCATPSNYVAKTTQFSIPHLNEPTSAAVGDRMVYQGTSTLTRGIVLGEPDNIQHYKFSAGFYPQTGEDGRYTYHSFIFGTSTNGLGTVSGAKAATIESLRASKSKQELCVLDSLRVLAFGIKSCDTEHQFQRAEQPLVGTNNFQQSLIYSGRAGSIIKVAYREFSGDIARPAYSNDVQYDLSQSEIITYKGATIKVLEADNQHIRYIVTSNFNTDR